MNSKFQVTPKRIYNPVTHKYYVIRQNSSKAGTKGEIKGLWGYLSSSSSNK